MNQSNLLPKTECTQLNEEKAIHGIVQLLESSWNVGDSAGYATSFAEDADFIDILGRHHRGRSTIEAGHKQIFDTIYRGSRNRYTVEHIRLLRPDIAIAYIHSSLLSRLGNGVDDATRGLRADQPMSTAQARPTLVLSKNDGEWEIVAFQNTKIAEGIMSVTV